MALNILNYPYGTNVADNTRTNYTLIQELIVLLKLSGSNPLTIAMDSFEGVTSYNIWGNNPSIILATVPEDIWDGGGIYNFPTVDQTHSAVSTSIQDVGVLISSGTLTSEDLPTTLIDTSATFITDGVLVGDQVLDDTITNHSIVTAVTSETELEIEEWHHSKDIPKIGDDYRIVHPNGTGAAVLHIVYGWEKEGLDPESEFIILNGITPVPTVKSYYRIVKSHIHGAGSNKSNVGIITLTADIDATITNQINSNNGQSESAMIYVPKNKTAFITNVSASMYRPGGTGSTYGNLELRSNTWGTDGEKLEYAFGISSNSGTTNKDFNPYKVLRGHSDLWTKVTEVSDNGVKITAGFDVILVNNDIVNNQKII